MNPNEQNGNGNAPASAAQTLEALRKLVDAPSSQSSPNTSAPQVEQPTGLLAGTEKLVDDPIAGLQTPRPLWSNPFAKGALVLTGTGVVGLIVMSFSGIGAVSTPPAPVQSAPITTSEVSTAPNPETGRMKADLALAQQSEQLSQLNSTPKGFSPRQTPGGTAQSGTLPPPIVRTARINNLPASPSASYRPSLPQSPPRFNVGLQSSEDPQKAWNNLSGLGDAYFISQNRSTQVAQTNVLGGSGNPSTPARSGPDYVAESNVLKAHISNSGVLVSTKAKALLETPVIFEAGTEGISQEDRFSLRLGEDLLGSDKRAVIPTGSIVISKIQSVSPNGLVRLSVESFIDSRTNEQIDIPAGAVVVRGNMGNPLFAHNVNDRGPEISPLDMGLFFVAGAGKAAELFNRPTSQSVQSSVNGFSATTVNPPPNLAAGFIDGGAQSLVSLLTQRNIQAAREIQARPNVWMISAGTVVQVVVNHSIPGF